MHLSFDAQFLHVAPPDLIEEGVSEQHTTAKVVSCCSTITNESNPRNDSMVYTQKQL